MRYLFLAIGFFGTIVLLSCSSKQKMANQSWSQPDLTGTWELREAQNGMMPNASYPPGNGNYYRFTPSSFEEYRNGSLAGKGSYAVVPDTTASQTVGLELPQDEFLHRLVLSADSTAKIFITLRDDSLTMVSGFFPADGGSQRTYVKVKE